MNEDEFKSILRRAIELESIDNQKAQYQFTKQDLEETSRELNMDRKYLDLAISEHQSDFNHLIVKGKKAEVKRLLLNSYLIHKADFQRVIRSHEVQVGEDEIRIFRKRYPTQAYVVHLSDNGENETAISWQSDFSSGVKYWNLCLVMAFIVISIYSVCLWDIKSMLIGLCVCANGWAAVHFSLHHLEAYMGNFLQNFATAQELGYHQNLENYLLELKGAVPDREGSSDNH